MLCFGIKAAKDIVCENRSKCNSEEAFDTFVPISQSDHLAANGSGV